MRYLLLVVALLMMCSCGQRGTWSCLPDRNGHAYNAHPQEVASADTPAQDPQVAAIPKENVPVGPIQAGERYHKMESGERLYQVAEQYGASLYWLIKRNDLGDLPYGGQRLIVPGSSYR